MKYRVKLKSNGHYYPQYKGWLMWRNFTEPYYDYYCTEQQAIDYITEHCKHLDRQNVRKLAAEAYIPKEYSCQK